MEQTRKQSTYHQTRVMSDLNDVRETQYCAGKRYSDNGRAPGAADPDSATVHCTHVNFGCYLFHLFFFIHPPYPGHCQRLESTKTVTITSAPLRLYGWLHWKRYLWRFSGGVHLAHPMCVRESEWKYSEKL